MSEQPQRLPLSIRLYRQQQKLEHELRALAHPPAQVGNPFHVIDPAAWGEANYYIEDRIDPSTGASLGPGTIILAPHQKKILRHAMARVVDIEQMFVNNLVENTDQIVDLPLYMGGKGATAPIYRGKGLILHDDDDDDITLYSNVLIIGSHHHHHHVNRTSVLLYKDNNIAIPESLSATMPTLDDCKSVLQFIIACSLNPHDVEVPLHDVEVPLDQIPNYCRSLPNYDQLQEILQFIAPDSNYIAGLHKLFVTSTRYKWSTIVYSCPKKSGKTRVSAMLSSWLARYSLPYSEIYCLANDGKQSADRVLSAVKKSVTLAKAVGKGEMAEWEQVKMRVELPGGQFIEAIPVDPEGEAGSQPTGSFWSELWGFNLSAKERLWTELTIPPTKWGQAIRWVESYAGFEGESPVLWQLYLQGVDEAEHPQGEGKRHPLFQELPVYVNERAGMFCYWDHKPRMVWQTPEYYQSQAATMPENEFRRVHKNEWVTPLEQAIPIDRWDQLAEKLPSIGKNEPIVLGVDLSVSGDYSALVVVSKHPRPESGRMVAIRGVYVWEPQAGQKIDYSVTIMPAIRRWVRNKDGSMNYNVVCVTYDEYQAHLMSIELTNELGVWWQQFSQGKGTPQHPGRPVADKMLFDLVMSGKLSHDGNVILRQHVHNAAAKTTDEGRYMRFVKKREDAKIDALVAASMAVCMISTLNV